MSFEDRARLRIFGGSQIASLIRCFEITENKDTFLNFLNRVFDSSFTGNVYTQIGHACESLILHHFQEDILESNIRHMHYDFGLFQLCSTPDAILKDGTVVEIKTKINPKKKIKRFLNSQHALQLIYYMCMHDKQEGCLLYYSPMADQKTIAMIDRYDVTLTKEDRAFFTDILVYCCTTLAELRSGESKPSGITTRAIILKDYIRLFRRQDVEHPITGIWSTHLDELLAQVPQ